MQNILKLNYIRVGLNFKTKDEVLNFISDLAYENKVIKSKNDYHLGLLKRELECTTGFGDGFAIPHCKSDTVNFPSILVCSLDSEIEWESLDNKPVKFVIALAIPENQKENTHLKILSSLARFLMDRNFTQKLKEASRAEEIYSIINKKLEGVVI